MHLFSRAHCLSFSVSLRPRQTPSLAPSPPCPPHLACPPQTSSDGRACTEWAAHGPSRLKLLCCFSVHFCISSQSGGGRLDQSGVGRIVPTNQKPAWPDQHSVPTNEREGSNNDWGSRQARTAVVTHGIRRCGVIR